MQEERNVCGRNVVNYGEYVCIVLRSFQVLYTFVLCAKKVTIFELKMLQNLQTLQDCIFLIYFLVQHFATKLCNSNNLTILFLAVVKCFVVLDFAWIEGYSIMQIFSTMDNFFFTNCHDHVTNTTHALKSYGQYSMRLV